MGAAESQAGRVLAGKYLLLDRLGEGGFGSIWRAEHQVLRSPVAVKLIDLDVARKDGAVERFLREAQATAALRSPHVVQVLDYGVEGDQPFIVMELLEGENLAERLQREGPLLPLHVARIVTHVARAIGKAHELGIVHRDLKPENIFLVGTGDEEIAKVLDFGVAKIATPIELNEKTYTQTGSLIGTPYYMSPEQAQGNKTVDHRSDLWALGVITFEMMTGRRPFDGDALGDLVLTICVRTIAVPSAVAPVPPGFDAWFARAVERDPDARFQSARELALGLLQVVHAEETGNPFTSLDGFSQRPPTVETSIGTDIPSRPTASAFAATVRDEGLGSALFTSVPVGLSPVASPSSNIDLFPAEVEEADHLSPWALFGIALIALAAGASAVYGIFFLVRAHALSNDPVSEAASISSHPGPASTALRAGRSRFDVVAPNKPNPSQEGGNGRSLRTAPASSGAVKGAGSAPIAPPTPTLAEGPAVSVPSSTPNSASVPPEPTPAEPLPPAPAPIQTSAPPPNLAPDTPNPPPPAPLPPLSTATQTPAQPLTTETAPPASAAAPTPLPNP